MTVNNGRRVLAIGLDAAEPKLIHRLIEQGQMPALKSLLAKGRWLRVRSPANIGSGSIWPTFYSGREPIAHGVHGEWSWQPDTMTLVHHAGGQHKFFWQELSDSGFTVGVLDPPFGTPTGLSKGFEIFEWGPHDVLKGHMEAGPKEITDFLGQHESHPWSSERHENASADDPKELARLASSCLEGVKLRGALAGTLIERTQPDFAFIVFSEIHHAAHYLWQTSDFDPLLHSDLKPCARAIKPSVEEICREVDRQIANLIEVAGANHRVLVFSLHGMRASAGVPAFLQPLLCEKGFASLAPWSRQSWPRRASSLMAAVKRRTPAALKKLYYQSLTSSATQYLAQPTMLPAYDWSRTRAFSLPSDQHGWIRINLQSRESAGLVTPSQYDDTCRQLEELMRSLSAEDGVPLATQVFRTAANFEEARSSRLPDLVVHWSDAAFAAPAKIKGSEVRIQTIGKKFTGQHAPDGFCILAGENDLGDADCLLAKDMHLLITNWLLGSPDRSPA